LVAVDGVGSVEDVQERALAALKRAADGDVDQNSDVDQNNTPNTTA
jgi:hypothetical protein